MSYVLDAGLRRAADLAVAARCLGRTNCSPGVSTSRTGCAVPLIVIT